MAVSLWSRRVRDRVFGAMFVALVIATAVGMTWLFRQGYAVYRLTRGVGDTWFYAADGRPWFLEVNVAPGLTETSLLPPNAQPSERALEAAMLAGIDFSAVGTLWDPASCPAAVLPYLAWGVAISHWDPEWTEEQSRKNFDAVKRVAIPGNARSRILIHPLAEDAGGDFFHNGGKHWQSQNDPEWQTLRAWIMGSSR